MRPHQVKITLLPVDAEKITRYAREEGLGVGTFVRRLALRHLVTLAASEMSALAPRRSVRDRDPIKLGSHVSVWFSEGEWHHLANLAGALDFSISEYLRRYAIEAWLRARERLGSQVTPALSQAARAHTKTSPSGQAVHRTGNTHTYKR